MRRTVTVDVLLNPALLVTVNSNVYGPNNSPKITDGVGEVGFTMDAALFTTRQE